MADLTTDSTLTGRRHPVTSLAAAVIALSKTARARRRVLAALIEQPRTDEELQRDLAMGPNTQRPRRVELVDLGMVKASNQRRPTISGAQSIVWEATDLGETALAIAEAAA